MGGHARRGRRGPRLAHEEGKEEQQGKKCLKPRSENAWRCGACEGGAPCRCAPRDGIWEGLPDQARSEARHNSAWPGRGCAHPGALWARDQAGPPVGRATGRARQEQEPVRSKMGNAGPSRQQRLNGLVLPLRRGTATKPCAQVVLALPSGIPARTRRNGRVGARRLLERRRLRCTGGLRIFLRRGGG